MKYFMTAVTLCFLPLSFAAPLQAQVSAETSLAANASMTTAIARHGQLSIDGPHILGENGQIASLAGPSFFWSNTGWSQDRFYNQEAVKYFASDWNATIVRAAIGAQNQGSYLEDPEGNLAKAYAVIDGAIAAGIYVVVDWHSHKAEETPEAAEEFFTQIATKYGNTPNVLYEIYNEPLNTTDWDTVVKPYADRLIKTIRAIDPDNIIIVGTQSWAQDVDKAADSPITGAENIAYSLHFYAASHKADKRAKAQYAIDKGLPIIITEWGGVDYSGDGKFDKKSTGEWMTFAKDNGLSHMAWAVSDKDEGASYFKTSAPSTGPWEDKHLTRYGKFIRSIIREW